MPIQLLQVVVFRVYSAHPAVLFGPLCPSNGGTGHFVTLRFLRTEGMHVPESGVYGTLETTVPRAAEAMTCGPGFSEDFGTAAGRGLTITRGGAAALCSRSVWLLQYDGKMLSFEIGAQQEGQLD